jgi:hypothetical protein
MLTEDEKNLILKLLNDVKIAPLDPNALQVVGALQSVARKIVALPKEEKKLSENTDFS